MLLAKGSWTEETRVTLSKGCSFWRGVLLSEITVPNPELPGAPIVQIPLTASALPETPVAHHHEYGAVQAQRYKCGFPGSSPLSCL